MEITIRNVAMIAGITVLAMWALNQAAGRSTTARKIIRGTPVNAVPSSSSPSGRGSLPETIIV